MHARTRTHTHHHAMATSHLPRELWGEILALVWGQLLPQQEGEYSSEGLQKQQNAYVTHKSLTLRVACGIQSASPPCRHMKQCSHCQKCTSNKCMYVCMYVGTDWTSQTLLQCMPGTVYTRVHTHKHRHTDTQTHTKTHTHTHTHHTPHTTHARTHARTHTHTHTRRHLEVVLASHWPGW